MSRLFLSYRNSDTGPYAGRLADRLARFQFSAVFQDREAIAPGANFGDRIREEIARCTAVLVLIGKGWLDARDAAGRRRLDNPEDWVRREVSIALELDLLVVPVLFDATPPPAGSQLPRDLAGLANQNAYHFDGRYFDRDADDLAGNIEKALVKADQKNAPPAAAPATGLLQQLRIIWIVLFAITLGSSLAPIALPGLPHQFWIFPATMTVAAFTWWLYWLSAALPVARVGG